MCPFSRTQLRATSWVLELAYLVELACLVELAYSVELACLAEVTFLVAYMYIVHSWLCYAWEKTLDISRKNRTEEQLCTLQLLSFLCSDSDSSLVFVSHPLIMNGYFPRKLVWNLVLQETVDAATPISSGLRWHTECGTSHRMLVTGVPTCIVWTSYRMIPGPASRPVPVSEHPWICWKLETQSVEGGQWACWVYRATSAHKHETLQEIACSCKNVICTVLWLPSLWSEGCTCI